MRLGSAAGGKGRAFAAPLGLLGEARLAQLAAAGDERAFATIYERYHQELYRYCRAIVRDSEDARDAVQATMLKALRAIGGWSGEGPLKAWLYKIAHNESISLLRRRRPQEEIAEETGTGAAAVDEVAAERARLAELLADLNELPARQRGALVMRELSGLEYDEIAAAFSISPVAAKQLAYEARRSLQETARGRDADCDSIQLKISVRDRRTTRARGVRAHLRDCAPCRDFHAALAARPAALAAVPALPLALGSQLKAALGLPASSHGGILGWIGGGAGKGAAGASAAKSAAAVGAALTIAAGGAIAVRSELVGAGGPGPELAARTAQPAKATGHGGQLDHRGARSGHGDRTTARRRAASGRAGSPTDARTDASADPPPGGAPATTSPKSPAPSTPTVKPDRPATSILPTPLPSLPTAAPTPTPAIPTAPAVEVPATPPLPTTPPPLPKAPTP